ECTSPKGEYQTKDDSSEPRNMKKQTMTVRLTEFQLRDEISPQLFKNSSTSKWK
ncbi:Hypothetical predicted protein, partial [Pelobates cultripes]